MVYNCRLLTDHNFCNLVHFPFNLRLSSLKNIFRWRKIKAMKNENIIEIDQIIYVFLRIGRILTCKHKMSCTIQNL